MIHGPSNSPLDCSEGVREARLRYEGWQVVGACGIGLFFAAAPLNVFALFVKPLSDHFSWSREAVASAYGALSLVAAASAPLVGAVLDRIGARRVIVPCLALSGCAVASLSVLTSHLWHLWVVFGVLGLATMGASPIAHSRAIFGWFDVLRGRALGLVLSGAAISGIVLPPAAQALIAARGWRIAWLSIGTATLVFALPIVVGFVRDRPTAQFTAHRDPSGVTVRSALRSRTFWTLIVVVFGATLASNGAIVHLAALLSDRGVPASDAALCVSAIGASGLVGRLLTGWLLDRFRATRILVFMLAVAALGTFLLASAESFTMGVVAAICIGFGAGGETDVIPYLLSRSFGLRSLATLYGFNWTAWGLAAAAGPILMGRVFDTTGSYSVALIALGFITLVVGVLTLTCPPAPVRSEIVAAAAG